MYTIFSETCKVSGHIFKMQVDVLTTGVFCVKLTTMIARLNIFPTTCTCTSPLICWIFNLEKYIL